MAGHCQEDEKSKNFKGCFDIQSFEIVKISNPSSGTVEGLTVPGKDEGPILTWTG